MKMMKSIALLLSCLAATGCSTSPVTLTGNGFLPEDHNYPKGKARMTAEKADHACDVELGVFEDKRRNANTLGTVAGRLIRTEDLGDVVRDGFKYHFKDRRDIRVVESVADNEPRVVVDAEILKAHMNSVATSMSANVALRITVGTPENSQQVLVRGRDTSMNWASGEGEIRESLSLAVMDAAEGAAPHIASQCHLVTMSNRAVSTSP